MTRRFRLILLISCVVPAILIAGLIGFIWALRYEPKFYRDILAEPPDGREEASDEMLQRVTALVSDVRKPGKWQAQFSVKRINGWLAVDFEKNHPHTLPPFMHDPRVAIEPGLLVLACRYDSWFGPTVLFLAVEPYVPEENALALRILKARAGLIPIPLGKVLDEITETARQSEWKIEWRQSGGDPVALLYPAPPATGDIEGKIESIHLIKGEIRISGSTKRKE
jgi:hypothetical protein